MAASVSAFRQSHRPVAGSIASASPDVPIVRHRFHVLAAGITDAVMSIGGLIFDRAMAGWDVSVFVAGGRVDDRPIRILGARVVSQPTGPVETDPLLRPQLLAAATDVMVRNDTVRRHVLEAGDDGETSVLLWGRHPPTVFDRTFVAGRHQPSPAAHVFKAQALIAGGSTLVERADEAFYSLSSITPA